MPWFILINAGLLGIVRTYFMKESHGFSRPVPSGTTGVGMIISFGLLSAATRTLPLGAADTVRPGSVRWAPFEPASPSSTRRSRPPGCWRRA